MIAQPGSAPAFWEHDYRGLLSTLFESQKEEKMLIHFSLDIPDQKGKLTTNRV